MKEIVNTINLQALQGGISVDEATTLLHNKGYSLCHTASRRGYQTVKTVTAEQYDGRYGKCIMLHIPSKLGFGRHAHHSNRYHEVLLFKPSEQCPSIDDLIRRMGGLIQEYEALCASIHPLNQ